MGLPWSVERAGDDQDEPDFFVMTPEGVVGVEITQLFVDRQDGMAASPLKEQEMRHIGKLAKLADAYYGITDVPVHAKFVRFNESALSRTAEAMAVAVGQLKPMESKRLELDDDIVVHLLRLPAEVPGYKRWQIASDRMAWVTCVSGAALEAVVEPKRRRLDAYRRSTARIVLLVVVDRTWGSGMIKNAGALSTQGGGFDAIYLHVLPDVARRLDQVEG